MADVAMYYPSTPPVFKSFAPEVVPGWLDMGWVLVNPNAPVPAPAGDPFPQYVTQAELEDFIPPLIANPASKVGAAGRAAFVAGRVLNNDGSPSTTKKLSVKLTADGTDIEDLVIESVA